MKCIHTKKQTKALTSLTRMTLSLQRWSPWLWQNLCCLTSTAGVNMVNKEETFSKNEIVLGEKSVSFTNGDTVQLLHNKVKFAGYEEGFIFELVYGNRIDGVYGEETPTPGKYHFMIVKTFYFPTTKRDEAVKAFEAFSKAGVNWQPPTFYSLDDCLTKEGYAVIPVQLQTTTHRETLKCELKQRFVLYKTFLDKWGGADSKAINHGAIRCAELFIEVLPSWLPIPSVTIDKDGAILMFATLPGGYYEFTFTDLTTCVFFSRSIKGKEIYDNKVTSCNWIDDWFNINLKSFVMPQ